MKVLYIASATVMSGGATKSLMSMISQMQHHGIEIEVVCPDDKGLTKWLQERGIRVHIKRFMAVYSPPCKNFSDLIKWVPRYLYYSLVNYRGKRSVKKVAKEFAPSIIHENTSTINVGYHAAKAMGIPYVMHIREFGPIELNMSVPGRKRRLKDHNVFSIPITKTLSKFLGQDSNPRSCQIYDGIVRSSDFRFKEDKKKWFLYAGRITEEKGISDLLEAYANYARKTTNPYPLHVCGDGDSAYVGKMKSFVAENGIENLVVWLGEKSDIADYMAETTATIMPSRNEGLGRVMPEAMTNGSLCVVRNVTGTKEQLENGLEFTGAPIAFPYDNKEQLTQALIDITDTVEKGGAFNEGSEYRKMIERSQAAVREFFTEERSGEKVLNFYKNIWK